MAQLTTISDNINLGSVWYNPTLNTLQYSYFGGGWSAGGALSTPRYSLAGAGTQNAGLAFGGTDGFLYGLSCTEEYNGTSWSSGGALITGRFTLAGAGTQTAGLAFGGNCAATPLSCTEEYNIGINQSNLGSRQT
jgi:hypothetical protein